MRAELTEENDSRIGLLNRTDFIASLPVLVIMPHSRCNCRCMMCDIWKIRQVRELTAEDFRPHRDSIRALGVQSVVFSGGEPMLHSHLPDLSFFFRSEGIRVTLLTAGLLLEKRAAIVAESFDDVIASLDGPEEIHDRIRGVPGAFGRLLKGIAALRAERPDFPVHARCTVQKNNFNRLRDTVAAARRMNFNSISFLAADLSSAAFNRAEGWPEERRSAVRLDSDEVDELAREMEALICENETDIHERFILENASKLRKIVRHFRVQLGQCSPISPRCNAPWVSAVIGSDGSLLPCFFHPSIGNIHEKPLVEILNSDHALNFRANLNIATNPTCQRCVCSLYLKNPPSAED